MAPRGHDVNGLRVAKARQGLPDCPSQAEFARRVGIHWVTQSRIENGKAKVSLELLERFAEETGTTREYLLGVDEEEEEAALMGPLARDLAAALHAEAARVADARVAPLAVRVAELEEALRS